MNSQQRQTTLLFEWLFTRAGNSTEKSCHKLEKGLYIQRRVSSKVTLFLFINFPKLSVYKLLPFNNSVSYGVVGLNFILIIFGRRHFIYL